MLGNFYGSDNSKTGKVFPVIPEHNFSFNRSDIESVTEQLDSKLKDEDDIVWGEHAVDVKEVRNSTNSEGIDVKKQRRQKRESAVMHVENAYEDKGDAVAAFGGKNNEVAFGGARKNFVGDEMRNIESRLREAMFDKNIHARRKGFKREFQEGAATKKHDTVHTFSGHSGGPAGIHYVKPKPPPGTILISHNQLKTMKDTLKSAYLDKIKEIKIKAEKFKEKMYEREKEIDELRMQNDKLKYEKDHLSTMQGGMGLENLRQLGNRGVGQSENRFVTQAAKKREEQRKKLLAALDKDDDGSVAFIAGDLDNPRYKGTFGTLILEYDRFMRRVHASLPLQKDIATIESRYGSSVAAFFKFFQFVIFMYFILSLVNLTLLGYHVYRHQLNSHIHGDEWDIQSLNFALLRLDRLENGTLINIYNNTNMTDPSMADPLFKKQYNKFCDGIKNCKNPTNISSFVVRDNVSVPYITFGLFLANDVDNPRRLYKLFGSVVPKLLLPSSFNFVLEESRHKFAKQMGESVSVRLSDDAMYYTLNMVLCVGILIVVAINKVSYEDRKYKVLHGMESGDDGSRLYSKLTLAAWDHNIIDLEDAWDLKEAITDQFSQIVFQSEKEEEVANRTTKDRYKLYARRAVGVILNLCVMILGWVVILALTAYGEQIATDTLELGPTTANYFVTVGIPATVATMNTAIPTIILMIIKFLEKWDDKKFETQLVILRIFLAKVMNIMIQLLTYLMVSDPYIFKRTGILGEKGYYDNYLTGKFQMLLSDDKECRADNVSYALVNLLLVQFLSSKVISIFMSFAKYGKYLATGRKGKWKTEFSVPLSVINLVYFCTVAFVTFAFFPFTFILVTFITYADFKFMKFQLNNFMYKPLVPFDAKSIGNFFTRLLLLAMIIGTTIIHLTLSNNTLPRVFDLKSNPSEEPNATLNDQFLERNYRVDRFRYFLDKKITNEMDDPPLVQNGNLKWNASIPGVFSSVFDPENYVGQTCPSENVQCCGVDGGVPCVTVSQIWSRLKQIHLNKLGFVDVNVESSSNQSIVITSEFSDFVKIVSFNNYSYPIQPDPDSEQYCKELKTKDECETENMCEYNEGDLCVLSSEAYQATADMACGPFISSENGYSALLDYIEEYGNWVRTVKDVIRDSNGTYVLAFWSTMFLLILNGLFKANSLHSQEIVFNEKQHTLRGQVVALMAKSNDLSRKLELKKRQAAAAAGLH